MSSLCWQAGILSFQFRKAGKSIGLSDNYIGTVAEENNATVYTLDRCLKGSRAILILPSQDDVIGVRRAITTGFRAAQFNEECALRPEAVENGMRAPLGDPHSLHISFAILQIAVL